MSEGRKARPEALLERQVLAHVGAAHDLALFKNECGEGFYPAVRGLLYAAVTPYGPAAIAAVKVALDRAPRIHYGLHVGSADLMGVLGPDGRMVSIELKSADGRMRPEQLLWLARMRELGALAEIVRSPEEAAGYIEDARRGRR